MKEISKVVITVEVDEEGSEYCKPQFPADMSIQEKLGLLEWAKAVVIELLKIENDEEGDDTTEGSQAADHHGWTQVPDDETGETEE
jgi:hypothetical protein